MSVSEQGVGRAALLKAGGAALAGGALVAAIEAAPAEASVNPTTPAGGALAGTYPSPRLRPVGLTDAHVASGAAIAESKLALAADGAHFTPCLRSLGSGHHQAKPGIPVAVCYYGASGANYSRSAPFTTVVAVDSTNLKVTFTAPDTGAVLVTLNAPVAVSAATNAIGWALLEGGATVANTSMLLSGDVAWARRTVQIRVAGLTPGSTHTYTWGWYGTGSSGSISMSANLSFFGFVAMSVARCA